MGFTPILQMRDMQSMRGDMDIDVRQKTEVWFAGRREVVVRDCQAEGVRLDVATLRRLLDEAGDAEEIVVPTAPARVAVGVYHIQGIATTEELAVAMCVDETYFIGPLPVNYAIPHERTEWPDMYCPLKQHDTCDDR